MDSGIQLIVTDSGILFLVELFAVIAGLFYVIFAARGLRICWLWGLINAMSSVWLFYQTELFAQTFLYMYYGLAAVYGWIAWRPSRRINGFLKVEKFEFWHHSIIIISGIGMSLFLAWYLEHYTTSTLHQFDAFTTVFSFIATAMVALKRIENWIYWMVVNLFSAFLYWQKELLWYGILMVIYTLVAIAGWWNWQKYLKAQENYLE
jgi:nicotinamide mononucleotide transporter